MSKKLNALQQALDHQSRPKLTGTPELAEKRPAASAPAAGPYVPPSREGKTNVSGWLHPDYKASMRLIQAKTGKDIQTQMAESLNDYFRKHNVPAIDGK